MDSPNLPLGFGMALAMNSDAMEAYSALSMPERETILQKASNVSSRQEMQHLVSDLAEQHSRKLR